MPPKAVPLRGKVPFKNWDLPEAQWAVGRSLECRRSGDQDMVEIQVTLQTSYALRLSRRRTSINYSFRRHSNEPRTTTRGEESAESSRSRPLLVACLHLLIPLQRLPESFNRHLKLTLYRHAKKVTPVRSGFLNWSAYDLLRNRQLSLLAPTISQWCASRSS